jgi:hypothetical protein
MGTMGRCAAMPLYATAAAIITPPTTTKWHRHTLNPTPQGFF